MALATTLATAFGKPVAEKLIKSLTERKDGVQRFEKASAAMASGMTAIEALKKIFGKDFLVVLNDALGTLNQPTFNFEAGTQSYIRLVDQETNTEASSISVLRDELNINLDRLSVLDAKGIDLRNHFRGLLLVWGQRCRELCNTNHQQDIELTLMTINRLLQGETRNYRQIYEMLSSTALGGVGALMVISGVLAATGTGVGVVSAVSLFLFGVPWLTVGALVLPGALLLVLAAKTTRPADDLSLSLALSYKLLDRLKYKKSTI